MNTMSMFWKKNIESFHKNFPTAYLPATSAKFVLEEKLREST